MAQTMQEALSSVVTLAQAKEGEPGKPTLFIMNYKKAGEKYFKLFLFDGNRRGAIERAQQHCVIAGVKFLYCEHALHDLDLEEAKILQGE